MSNKSPWSLTTIVMLVTYLLLNNTAFIMKEILDGMQNSLVDLTWNNQGVYFEWNIP